MDSSHKTTYKKRDGSTGADGVLYQCKILTMVLLNALTKVKVNWFLSTENEDGDKFDDLIFEFSKSAILLQAKHKINEDKPVTFTDLVSFNSKEFSLPKYYYSYQKIEGNLKARIKEVVLCTNLKLQFDENEMKYLKKKNIDVDSVLHFQGIDNVCYSFENWRSSSLKLNIEEYVKKQKEKVSVTDEDIDDFLEHFLLLPNYLGKNSLDNVIEETVSVAKLSVNMDKSSANIDSEEIFEDINSKITEWFREVRGRYLTEVDAKGFFCDIISQKYCDDLKLFDISFENRNQHFPRPQGQQENREEAKNTQPQDKSNSKDRKRIHHLTPEKEYILNVIKIYQALRGHKNKVLFVNPDEDPVVQQQIIDAFKVKKYTILVVVWHERIEKNAVTEMCNKMIEILNEYNYKDVILIAKNEKNLEVGINNLKISNLYETVTDPIKFTDLDVTTQKKFITKPMINFQGSIVNLKKLFKPLSNGDLNEIVDSETLAKLARGIQINVGLELKDLNKYYIDRNFIRDVNIIPEEHMYDLSEKVKEKVILIADSAGTGKSTALDSLQRSIKKNNPHLWVVRFDLKSYTEIIRETLEQGEKLNIVGLLNSSPNSKLSSEFEKRVFTAPNRVVLMLDGVDEVSPTYQE